MPVICFGLVSKPPKFLTELTRSKHGKYLFNHKALAKVFRGKLLAKNQLILPKAIPQKWVVACTQERVGDKALIYLGRYLYRGVIREKDILSCQNGNVTFRYQDSQPPNNGKLERNQGLSFYG